MNRRGQFFLLAAVIISVIVISLGVTTNRAVVQQEPRSFYDFSYQVDREVGEVFNYEIYRDISGGSVSEFVSLMADEIKDTDPQAGFIFIFGNRNSLNLSNYDDESIEITLGDVEEIPEERQTYWGRNSGNINGPISKDNCYDYLHCYICDGPDFYTDNCYESYELSGANEDASGTICTDNGCTTVEATLKEYDSDASTIEFAGSLEGTEFITVIVDGARLRIPVSEYSQVYFITRKKSGDESFISASR